MSLRLVRCPYCTRRFNVAGVEPGTRLRCGGCTAILSVPSTGRSVVAKPRLSRALAIQAGAGVAAGLIAALALWLALRPVAETPATPPVDAGTAKLPSPPPELPSEAAPGFVDDPVGRETQAIYREFPGSQFIFNLHSKPYLIALERSDRFIAKELVEEYARRMETIHLASRREMADALACRR